MHTTDNETGELLLPTEKIPQIDEYDIDMETGEPDSNVLIFPMRKTKFVIPRKFIQMPGDHSRCCIDPNDTYTIFKKEVVIGLQEDIISRSNKTSHRLFLIPSLFICFPFLTVLIVIVEACLHVWAHKKKSKNQIANVYYRSPLHIVTSQFCAICRNQSEMNQVSKIQDKRQKNWRSHIKHVAKSMY